jgi:hypothetical protein
MAAAMMSAEANLPVPVKRREVNVLSAMRSISTSGDNLKQQEAVAFLQNVMRPPLARHNSLVDSKRGAGLIEIQL